MRRPGLLLAILLLLCTSLSALAQVTDTYVIPAAANARGANNTRWMTQFSLFNPHLDHALQIRVIELRTGGAIGDEVLIPLPANATYISDNVLDDLFDREGTGALLVATFPEDNPGVPDQVINRAFLVNSNTYNNAASGTYGQTIPGVWAGLMDYDTDGISGIAHGIDNSTGLKFRTNVGAVNLGPGDVTVRVRIYDADGNTLQTAALFVPGYGHIQDRLPVAVEGGSVEFFVEDSRADTADFALVFPYTSTIDDLSGDPRYQTPALLASPGVIFGKKGVVVDTTQLGKKIDTNYARRVRAHANDRGTVNLVRTERGWKAE